MKMTLTVEPVLESCQHRQNEGTASYFAFKVVGLSDRFGNPLVLRSSEACYPGNDSVREFINRRRV